jgi:hypothetical protein
VYVFENQGKPMRISLLCGAIAIATSETMTPAYAELGGAPTWSSGGTNNVSLLAQHLSASSVPYTVKETTLSSGTIVREYVAQSGTVFAITWHGPQMAALNTLLGAYFSAYLQGLSDACGDGRRLRSTGGSAVRARRPDRWAHGGVYRAAHTCLRHSRKGSAPTTSNEREKNNANNRRDSGRSAGHWPRCMCQVSTALNTPALPGGNSILGVGVRPQDCGSH